MSLAASSRITPDTDMNTPAATLVAAVATPVENPKEITPHGLAALHEVMHSGAAEQVYAAHNNLTLANPKESDPALAAELGAMNPETFNTVFRLMHLPEAARMVEETGPWVAGQSEKTLAQQPDDVIMLHLSDYMATSNGGTINGALIEAAQETAAELMEILTLSEDELAERDDLNSPLAQKAKANAQSAKEFKEAVDRARTADKEQREEAKREEERKKWEEEVWAHSTYNVGNISLTGAAIDEIIGMLGDRKKRPQLIENYKKKYGGTDQEADNVLTDTEKYLKAKKRQEFLKATGRLDEMTPQDQADLNLINTNPKIQEAVQFLEEQRRTQANKFGVDNKNKELQTATVEGSVLGRKQADDGSHESLRIPTSAANEYVADSSLIKTTVSPQDEFNPLGNPMTAVAATANMNGTKPTPAIIVAESKISTASVDMM